MTTIIYSVFGCLLLHVHGRNISRLTWWSHSYPDVRVDNSPDEVIGIDVATLTWRSYQDRCHSRCCTQTSPSEWSPWVVLMRLRYPKRGTFGCWAPKRATVSNIQHWPGLPLSSLKIQVSNHNYMVALLGLIEKLSNQLIAELQPLHHVYNHFPKSSQQILCRAFVKTKSYYAVWQYVLLHMRQKSTRRVMRTEV